MIEGFPPELTCRRLGPEDLTAVIALHREIRAGLPPDMIAHETDEFFAQHMDVCGRIFGAFLDRRLVVYSVLGLPGPRDPNFGTDHGLPVSDLARVAHLDGSAVQPDWQGLGLQRAMSRWRMRAAAAFGREIALSTVAPNNLRSLANLLACGLEIRGVAEKFGGTRFLMRKDLAAAAITMGESVCCRRDDLVEVKKLLAKGYSGAGYDPDNDTLRFHNTST